MFRRPQAGRSNRRNIGASGGVGVFDAADYGTVLAWWDPNTLSTVTKDGSDLVSSFAPRTGNAAWTVAQAAGAKKPTWHATNGPNGRACLLWTAASATWMATATSPASNQPTTLVMQLYSSTAAIENISDAKSALFFRRFYHSAAQLAISAGAAIGVNFATGVWGKAAGVYNGASGAVRWNAATATGDVGAVNGAGIVFGGLQDDTGHFTGRTGHIILYSGALNAATLTALFAALDAA